jgi:hypothetical protein
MTPTAIFSPVFQSKIQSSPSGHTEWPRRRAGLRSTANKFLWISIVIFRWTRSSSETFLTMRVDSRAEGCSSPPKERHKRSTSRVCAPKSVLVVTLPCLRWDYKIRQVNHLGGATYRIPTATRSFSSRQTANVIILERSLLGKGLRCDQDLSQTRSGCGGER